MPIRSQDSRLPLINSMRQRWLQGEHICVETYLQEQPNLALDSEALLDLIYLEWLLREEVGQPVSMEHFAHRFPEHVEALRRQIDVDRALVSLGLPTGSGVEEPDPSDPLAPESANGPPRKNRILILVPVGGLILLVATSIWLMSGNPSGLPGLSPTTQTSIALPPRVAQISLGHDALRFQVVRERRTVGLQEAVPVQRNEEAHLQAEVPPGLHAGLFLIRSNGQAHLLVEVSPRPETQIMHYPAAAGKTVPLSGPAGTSIVLLLGSRAAPIRVDQVPPLPPDWPALPSRMVLVLNHQGIAVAEGESKDTAPDDRVRQDLERMHSELRNRFELFEALIFSLQPGP